MKTSKITYGSRNIKIRVCDCGETPIVTGGSTQSPFEQSITIQCAACGKHNFRVGWCVGEKSFNELLDLVVEKWNNGEAYEKDHRCKDDSEYNKMFVAW